MIPLVLIGIVPLMTGDVVRANFFPFVPLFHEASGLVRDGSWNRAGWTIIAGGMFLAAWSTYGFETAVCYTSELKNPKTDTFKAIFYSGLLCVAVYALVPFAFQGFLGVGHLVSPPVFNAAHQLVSPPVYDGMLAPGVYSGAGVAEVMVKMVHAGRIVGAFVVIMLVLALVLALMTSMGGSSRTLYQASVEGWLPRYLSKLNRHAAPSNAMWTDLCFNMLLLLMSDYVFVLAASNCGYLIFSFMNLNAGWIHRMDRPNHERPWKAPTILIAAGAVFGFVNLAFMGMGADVFGSGTLLTGLIFAALILPVFFFRHYIQDKGVFPSAMMEHLELDEGGKPVRRAGILPYVALGAGVLVLIVFDRLAVH
jgi:amino acid transporter